MTIVELVLSAVAIVAAAALFTNAIEILGERLELGQGAVGSVLAAVGTALPETMIPVVAILGAAMAGGDAATGGEIGVGAILGAPFLLATLAMFVVGASAYGFRKRREHGMEIRCQEDRGDFPWCKVSARDVIVDKQTIAQHVGFFLVFFTVAAAGTVQLPFFLKMVVAPVLVVAYAYYVRRALRSGGALGEVPERLILWRSRSRPPTWAVAGQLVLALILIVGGAQVFVEAV